jgi:hypothetical protein
MATDPVRTCPGELPVLARRLKDMRFVSVDTLEEVLRVALPQ